MKTLYSLLGHGTIRNVIWIVTAIALVGCCADDCGGGTPTPPPPSPCESKPCPDLSLSWVSGTQAGVSVEVINIGDQATGSSATVTGTFSGAGMLPDTDSVTIPSLAVGQSWTVPLRLSPHDPHFPPPRPSDLIVSVFLNDSSREEKSKTNNSLNCDWSERNTDWSCSPLWNSTAAIMRGVSGASPYAAQLAESKKELLKSESSNLTVGGPFTGKYFGVIQGMDDTFAPFLLEFAEGEPDLVGLELLPGLKIRICRSNVAVYDFFDAAEVTITDTSFTTNTLETNNSAKVILSGNLSEDGTAINLALKIVPDNNCGEETLTATPQKLIFEADVSITESASPDPAAAGGVLQYTLMAKNNGRSFTREITVEDILPQGVSFVPDSSAGNCVLSNEKLTCTAGGLAAGATAEFVVGVRVDADLVYNAGGPITITNQASVTSAADVVDPDLSNNTTSLDTLVIAAADLEIGSFETIDPPTAVLVGEEIEITLKKILLNNGPSSPIKAKLINRVSITTGGTSKGNLAPEVSEQPEVLGEVVDTYTVSCLAPGQQHFTFTTEIQPLHPEDVDPEQSNNVKTLQLDVECVLPVAIDIRPKTINLNSKRPIPVLVLTTEAGEFGLPLAFDASRIDPLSVRFGPHDLVWLETGGASEVHHRGHRNRAGMLFHFAVIESGLVPGNNQACVKGTAIDAAGRVYEFFGCDSVFVKAP